MSNPVLATLDFVDAILEGKPQARENLTVLATYVGMLVGIAWVYATLSSRDFSFVLTLAGMLQACALFLLLHKVQVQRGATGISAKSLQMYALYLCCRLASTCVKNGYLPVDSTGDWLYQGSDIASLILVCQLLHTIHGPYRHTYQEEADTMPVWKAVPVLVLLAVVLHGHLNHSFFFDTVWALSLYVDTIAMVPQLWMVVAKGGEVEALTAHFVALTFLSRFLTWTFWYTAFRELAPEDGGFNKVGWMIMSAISMQLFLSADFMYHYFVWNGLSGPRAKGHGSSDMILPVA